MNSIFEYIKNISMITVQLAFDSVHLCSSSIKFPAEGLKRKANPTYKGKLPYTLNVIDSYSKISNVAAIFKHAFTLKKKKKTVPVHRKVPLRAGHRNKRAFSFSAFIVFVCRDKQTRLEVKMSASFSWCNRDVSMFALMTKQIHTKKVFI